MMNRPTSILILLGCTTLQGCYSRQPLGGAIPEPGTRIVATLTDAGAAAVSGRLGEGAVEVEGEVSAVADSAWTLHMLRVEHRTGQSYGWNRELVSFPRYALANPAEITLDKRRSWLAAGATVTGAFLLARAFQMLGAGGDDRGGDNPPPQFGRMPAGRR
jgi:hypothetical protein